jgi:hypothetical protein
MSNRLEDPVPRPVAVVGLAGVALIHVLDAHDTFVEAPYKGWLYVGLIASTLMTAGLLLRRPSRAAWVATAVLPLSAFAAFVWSRTVGLPQGADDIGNWWEPLGLSSIFVEACVAAVSLHVLMPVRRRAPVRVGLRAPEGASGDSRPGRGQRRRRSDGDHRGRRRGPGCRAGAERRGFASPAELARARDRGSSGAAVRQTCRNGRQSGSSGIVQPGRRPSSTARVTASVP